MICLGVGINLYLTVLWMLGHRPIGTRPLLWLGILLVLAGVQCMFFGLLAECLLHLHLRADYRYLNEVTAWPPLEKSGVAAHLSGASADVCMPLPDQRSL